MTSAIEYLAKMEHRISERDNLKYRCSELAKQVATRLEEEGQLISIIRISRQRKKDRSYVFALTPRKYPDVNWEYHEVCLAGAQIWDPLIGRPIPIEEYFHEAFGEEFEFQKIED